MVQPPRFGDEDLAAIGPVQAYGPVPLGDACLGPVSAGDVQRQLSGIRTKKAPNEAARGPAPATPATAAPALGSLAALGFAAPRRTQALATLCDQLNQAQACNPGTDLVLRYEVKPDPGIA